VIERRYAEGHLHLLSAVRLRCGDSPGRTHCGYLYSSAFSWHGGVDRHRQQYELAWHEMFPQGADDARVRTTPPARPAKLLKTRLRPQADYCAL